MQELHGAVCHNVVLAVTDRAIVLSADHLDILDVELIAYGPAMQTFLNRCQLNHADVKALYEIIVDIVHP